MQASTSAFFAVTNVKEYIKKKSTLFLTVSIKRLHLEVAFSLHLQIKRTATQEGIKKKKRKSETKIPLVLNRLKSHHVIVSYKKLLHAISLMKRREKVRGPATTKKYSNISSLDFYFKSLCEFLGLSLGMHVMILYINKRHFFVHFLCSLLLLKCHHFLKHWFHNSLLLNSSCNAS